MQACWNRRRFTVVLLAMLVSVLARPGAANQPVARAADLGGQFSAGPAPRVAALAAAAPLASGPGISGVADNRSSYPGGAIPVSEKLEISFQVDNSVASNPQLPYDPSPPAGIQPELGISVDAQLSPDGFQTVYTQPAFYYQDFDYAQRSGKDWIYPTARFAWKARFSPDRPGTWQYRLTATDAQGTATTAPISFSVVASDSPGFVRVSQRDSRYFELDDGTYFPGLGYNMNFNQIAWDNPILQNQANFQAMGQSGVQLVRHWLSQWGIFGSYNNPWRSALRGSDYDGIVNSNPPTPDFQPYPGSEVAMRLQTGWNPYMFLGWLKQSPAVKPSTRYRVSIRYLIPVDLAGPATSGRPYGLVAKTGGWLDAPWQSGTGAVVTPYAAASPKDGAGRAQWSVLEGSLTTGPNEYFLPNFYLVLENTVDASPAIYAFIDRVDLQEDLGDGQVGPNIVAKPWMAHHYYLDQRHSYAFDRVLELAKEHGVYLKLVVLDKNEWILNHFDHAGNPILDNGCCFGNQYFYGDWRNVTKVRWLQQAWWRYLQARWGYSPNVHSWELLNEGDPYNGRHYTLADEFAKYMHQFGPNSHLATTSFWHSFPTTPFWQNLQYSNLDYADVHAYLAEGASFNLRVDQPTTGSAIPVASAADFYDSAAETQQLSLAIGPRQQYGVGKPTMRGEVGFTTSSGSKSVLDGDTEGIWLHKWVWAGINPGGVLESYWYTPEHIANSRFDHRQIFRRYYDFIKEVPLSNGNYQDAAASASDGNLRVWGQKDAVAGQAHLWIDNRNHTWKSVVDGVLVNGATGTVTLPGLPVGSYSASWYDTYQGSTFRADSVSTDEAGTIVLALPRAISTDLAVKLVRTGSAPAPTSTPLPTATPTPTPTPTGPTSCPDGQLLAEYFGNLSLSGTPSFSRCESSINHSWWASGPGSGLPADKFSVRWTGRIDFAAGDYAFNAATDDGMRAWLDGDLLIDAWYRTLSGSPTLSRCESGVDDCRPRAGSYTASRTLTAGARTLKVEYYERSGDAVAQFAWAQRSGGLQASAARTPTPTPNAAPSRSPVQPRATEASKHPVGSR